MSREYWSMKLQDTYVFYQKAYHFIEEVRYAEQDTPYPLIRFPEDSLPYLRFKLSDVRNRVTFDKFEIKFPEDRYVLSNNKDPIFGRRSMSRGYKLAPYRNSIKLTGSSDLQYYLNKTESGTFNDKDDLFKFNGEGMLFAPDLASTKEVRGIKYLYYNQLRVASVTRKKKTIKSNLLVNLEYVRNTWDDKIGKEIEAPELTEEAYLNLIKNVHESEWTEADYPDDLLEGEYTIVYDEESTGLLIKHAGNVWDIRCTDDLSYMVDEGGVPEETVSSIFNLCDEIGFQL